MAEGWWPQTKENQIEGITIFIESYHMDNRELREAFMKARFRAEEPEDGWPKSFGVVTACNPDGETISETENAELTQRLEVSLLEAGKVIFPVTGYDLDSDHEEPGFGVVCQKREEILKLGRKSEQVAVFWVEDGQVWLLFCNPDGEQIFLRPLPEMLGA